MTKHAHNPTTKHLHSLPLPSSLHKSIAMNIIKLHFNKLTLTFTCSCIKPKLSNILNPKPKPKPKHSPTTTQKHPHSSNSTTTYSNTSTTTSMGAKFGQKGGNGVAIEKDSNDPYLDFKQSMLQMIVENEIYSKDELRELLNCFLQLNSYDHHGVIISAFSEIWNGLFFVKAGSKRGRRRKARLETDRSY